MLIWKSEPARDFQSPEALPTEKGASSRNTLLLAAIIYLSCNSSILNVFCTSLVYKIRTSQWLFLEKMKHWYFCIKNKDKVIQSKFIFYETSSFNFQIPLRVIIQVATQQTFITIIFYLHYYFLIRCSSYSSCSVLQTFFILYLHLHHR